jgi:hypothetical protein
VTEMKSLLITEETWEKLRGHKIMVPGEGRIETFSETIARLLDAAEARKK